MKPKRTYNSGRWTEARWRSFVVSALRAAFRRWPPKSDVLKNAKRGTMMSRKVNREVNAYICALCNNLFTYTSMQVDHKKPVVHPKKGFAGFTEFVNRLFCEAKDLQAVCKPCHKRKTDKERKQRVQYKRIARSKE